MKDWLKTASFAVPWVTVGLLFLMMCMVGQTLSTARGVLVDLPEGGGEEGARTSLTALVLSMPKENLLFFDDARFSLDDETSLGGFGRQLSERVQKTKETTLLIVADRRIASGRLLHLADIARNSGVRRVLFAVKREGNAGE